MAKGKLKHLPFWATPNFSENTFFGQMITFRAEICILQLWQKPQLVSDFTTTQNLAD